MYGIIRSGMASAMHEISVVSNNISNAGSTGFKKSDVSFADIYGSGTPDVVARTATGDGSMIAGTRRNDGQGAVMSRGGALNLAMLGSGMFVTSPPNAEGNPSTSQVFTRNGEFSIDKDGFIRSSDASFVLGTDGGAIQVPYTSEDDVNLSQLEISSDGTVSASYGNIVENMGQLAVANFPNLGGLRNIGGARFVQSEQSGEPLFGTAEQNGFGSIQSGALEGSNVDITQEMTVMIRAQQQFNGASRVLQANSDMVEKLTR